MGKLIHSKYQIDSIIIDCHNMTIRNGDGEIKLPVKVFEFLKLFISNDKNTVSHEDAISEIWNGNESVGKRGYINYMWQIRKAFNDLGVDGDALFITLPKVGYVMTTLPTPIIENKTPKKRYFYIVITVIIISILLFILLLLKGSFQKKPRKFAVLDNITNYQGVEEYPAVSNDGEQLAFAWLQENKKSALYIKNLKNEDEPLKLLSSGKYEEFQPVWSPDDSMLAYVRINSEGQCEIRRLFLTTGHDQFIDDGCVFSPFKGTLDWSPDGKKLLYRKKMEKNTVLFSYDFIIKSSVQISFPDTQMNDVTAIWSSNSKQVVFVREKEQQSQLFLLDSEGRERILLNDLVSITGLSRGKSSNEIYVNFSQGGKILTYLIDYKNLKKITQTIINQIPAATNLSYNFKDNKIYVTKHSSNEYILRQGFNNSEIFQRVSSSHRDLYGSYNEKSASTLFVSNRSGNWELWVNTSKGNRLLTSGGGNISYASQSPDGTMFATATKEKKDNSQKLYIGCMESGELNEVDLGTLVPRFPTWSVDGNSIYFSATDSKRSGIYQYKIKEKELKQITISGEGFAVDGGRNYLYVSRRGEQGIWRVDKNTKESTKIVSKLLQEDLGSFFIQGKDLYYVERTFDSDYVKKYREDTSDEIIASYPSNTVRKYFGISKADNESFLITLNSVYDSDIYSFEVE